MTGDRTDNQMLLWLSSNFRRAIWFTENMRCLYSIDVLVRVTGVLKNVEIGSLLHYSGFCEDVTLTQIVELPDSYI